MSEPSYFHGRPIRTLADLVDVIREVVESGDDLQLTNRDARMVLEALDSQAREAA